MSQCPDCGRKFKIVKSMRQHRRDKHHSPRLADREDVGKEGALAVLKMVGEDMSDGAYFAFAEDLGLSIDDIVDAD